MEKLAVLLQYGSEVLVYVEKIFKALKVNMANQVHFNLFNVSTSYVCLLPPNYSTQYQWLQGHFLSQHQALTWKS